MPTDVNIRQSGRNAYAAGRKSSDNPFAVGSPARLFWFQGYKAERKEAGRAPLVHALRNSNLDVTVKIIQTALRIKTGDVAGQCFTDTDRKNYAELENAGERAHFIKPWLKAELDDAAAAVDGVTQ